MEIKTKAFKNGGKIPSEYTCDGRDVWPDLEISGVPEEAESLALAMDDPDSPSGVWDHWVVWNIPADTKIIKSGELPPRAAEGINTWGRNGYGGPCPGSGEHRYFFKLYALDSVFNLSSSAHKTDLEKAMDGHVLAKAELSGRYQRQQ